MARISAADVFPVSIISFDLDSLKVVNDTCGHAAGDELIRATAQVLRKVIRSGDTLARVGGDEFVLIIPGAGRTIAEETVDRIKAAFACHNLETHGHKINISLGAATAESAESLQDALIEADRNMYREKYAHRNTDASGY